MDTKRIIILIVRIDNRKTLLIEKRTDLRRLNGAKFLQDIPICSLFLRPEVEAAWHAILEKLTLDGRSSTQIL